MLSKILFVFVFLFANNGHSATKAQKRLYRYLKSPYSTWHLGLSSWQELIEVESASQPATLETSFTGLNLGYLRQRPHKKLKWVRSYGASLDFGIAKAQAGAPAVDRLKEQPWLRASLLYGYIYRTGFRTSLGFFVPVSYKHLLWDIEDSLVLKDNGFSVGLSGSYLYKFNSKTSLSFMLEHQFMWNASIWTINIGREFR